MTRPAADPHADALDKICEDELLRQSMRQAFQAIHARFIALGGGLASLSAQVQALETGLVTQQTHAANQDALARGYASRVAELEERLERIEALVANPLVPVPPL